MRLFGLTMQSRTWERLATQMAGPQGDGDLDEADRLLGIERDE